MLIQIGEEDQRCTYASFPAHESSRTGCADNGLDC